MKILMLAGSQKAAFARVPDAPFAQRVVDETIRYFNERLRA